MAEAPQTRVTLLTRLKDVDDIDAWTEFSKLYGPVIYSFARKRGLQDADAADIVQDVLRSVARNAHRMEYDPKRGTFRGWLYTITRNKIYTFLSSNKRKAMNVGDAKESNALESVPDDDPGSEALWELEYQRGLAARAMERVKHEFQENTWRAFWATSVEGKSTTDIGKELGMTSGAIYVAKSRVIARLRDEISALIAEAEDLNV